MTENTQKELSVYEIELLVEQRNHLISSIYSTNKSMHLATMAIGTIMVTVATVYINNEDFFVGLTLFITVQMHLLLLLFMVGLFLSTNIDRDYIRAIDLILLEKAGIRTLFFQGELGYQHINKFSMFSTLTYIMGFAVASTFIVVVIFSRLWEPLLQIHPFCLAVICVEISGLVILVIVNVKYKHTGQSQYFSDCTKHLLKTLEGCNGPSYKSASQLIEIPGKPVSLKPINDGLTSLVDIAGKTRSDLININNEVKGYKRPFLALQIIGFIIIFMLIMVILLQ